ncbi:MAG: helix-turn-helix domain-containing protein [Pseudomonadota bacterium]
MMTNFPAAFANDRLAGIERARRAVITEDKPLSQVAPAELQEREWIAQSWRRCLERSRSPNQRLAFDMLPDAEARRTLDANELLVQAGRPVLEHLSRAIADMRYFTILTSANGVVVDANGPIDRMDRRAHLITRVGVDLSEGSIGTSAISTALKELHPVWLHRGEHFYTDMRYYSCAGAPIFGPDGHCAGMLDVTGIEQPERPELMHLVAQSAQSIENTMVLSRPHALVVRLNWPGRVMGDDADGIVCLDANGVVVSANSIARQMVTQLVPDVGQTQHCSELFALPYESLFDAARTDGQPIEAPLWTGLRLHALPLKPGQTRVRRLTRQDSNDTPLALKDVEIALIKSAVEEARGNVMQAARKLGISRATVYRKLGLGRQK